jgi:hypothetical protein
MEDFTSYGELADVGFESKQQIRPEDEFFHSIYISGHTRPNHINIIEESGKFQIRGVEYNKTEIYFIITHVKRVLAKFRMENKKEKLDCFSFLNVNLPWKGTSGNNCGANSAERASISYCKDCRSQLIVTGIYCDKNGKPITLNEEGKPTFIFLRGKGTKYGLVSDYLGELSRKEGLEPIFTPPTEESLKFERMSVNNKRFVTKITMTEVPTDHGPKKAFKLEEGSPLSKESVLNILKLSKKTIEKFNEKFDWSRTNNSSTINKSNEIEDHQKFSDAPVEQKQNPCYEPKKETSKQVNNKDDVPFDFSNITF